MDYHKNAPWTAVSRERLARLVIEDGLSASAAALRFTVSAKTAAKWVGRYRLLGVAGLADRSSRPHRCPRQTSSSFIEKVLALRREHMPGYEIARRTGLSPASVSRILRRARLSRWRDLNPPPPVQRYEHPRPGDMLHLDIKGMTRFGEVSLRGDGRLRGKRKHPWLPGAACGRRRPLAPGLYPNAAGSEERNYRSDFLRSAVEYFRMHGIGIRSLLTDNGSSYRSRQFRHTCETMQIKHQRTRPYTPRTNGKAERFIQTALREWARAKHWISSEERDASLKSWTDYNRQRPHGSLNYKPPISRSDTGTTS